MTDNGGSTWPEQDAVDAWLKKHSIEVGNKESMELKTSVTKYRIDAIATVQAEIDELAEFLTDVAEFYDCKWVAVIALINKHKEKE